MQRLPCVSDKCPLQNHLQNKPIISTWRALLPRGLEKWMCRGFPCVTNEWPFQDFHLSKSISSRLCLQGNLNNEHEQSSPVSLRNSLLKTIFWVKLSYQLSEDLSSWRPEKWMYRDYCTFFCISHHASIYIMTQILLPHYKYESQTHYAKCVYRPNIFSCIYQKTANCNSFFTDYC